jgi:DNA mismatch repair protein MutS2
MEKLRRCWRKKKPKHEEGRKMETINIKIKQKLESYQELYDSNQKTIYVGQR